MISRPALRYHGGKFRLAPWIVQFFPDHTCYVEPYGGAASVLLQKPRSYAEVYNDLDRDVVTYFAVLRDPEQRQRLIESLVLTPYSRSEFVLARERSEDPVECARRLCIRAQMGFGSSGATKGSTGFRIDTKRKYGTAQSLWSLFPSSISEIGARLVGVMIENRNATDVMLEYDAVDTLHYVDPPYVHSTRVRSAGKHRYYRHEMTDAEHADMLDVVRRLRGFVVLSGYDSPLYADALGSWTKYQVNSRIALGRGGGSRVESLWLSPNIQTKQGRLIA